MSRLDPLLQLQTLDRLPRMGWIQRRVPAPETVGEHSLGTAFLVLALGPAVEPALDVDRAAVLALLHDVGEAHIGDLPRTARDLFPPGAKAAAERTAIERLMGPLSSLALDRAQEALAGDSREARFVEICDKLQLGVRLVGYVRSGIGGLEEFFPGLTALDCEEFAPCEQLRLEILDALNVP